jgi:aspartate aminotransferase
MDPGDEIIIPEPFYANYNGFSAASGVNVVSVISSIDTGFALPAIADFEKLITPKQKRFLCPGNPTGYLYSKEEMMQLAELVKTRSVFNC